MRGEGGGDKKGGKASNQQKGKGGFEVNCGEGGSREKEVASEVHFLLLVRRGGEESPIVWKEKYQKRGKEIKKWRVFSLRKKDHPRDDEDVSSFSSNRKRASPPLHFV